MKKRDHKGKLIFLLTAIFMLRLLAGSACGGQQTSANYVIQQAVLSCGGQDMVSAGYDLSSTFGQSGGIGVSTSSHYHNYGGFRHPFEIDLTPGALPWLLLLLMEDSSPP